MPPPKTKPMHDEILEVLKQMNYQGTVSKSHLQTLGAGAGAGNIIGVLHFFLLLAKSVVSLSQPENFVKMNFRDVDEGKIDMYSGEILTIELFMVPNSTFWLHFIVHMK